VISPKECPEELCAAFNGRQISASLASNVQVAFENLKLHVTDFLLLDLGLDEAAPFLKRVTTTFYDPPPYIIAADAFPCSMAQAEILNLGADAFVGKPLDIEEVLAVINAALRRMDRLAHPKPIRAAPPIKRGELYIDAMRRIVTMNGRPVPLTKKEFDILRLMADHPDMVFTKEQIYEQVWNEDYNFSTTSVSDMISSIRKKLGLDPKEGRYIQTVFGSGYRFVEPE